MRENTLVSVVVPIDNPEVHPKRVVEELAAALTRGGYRCEFVLVLDGPVGSVEREIDAIDCGAPVKVVRLQGGGLGESIALSAGVAKAQGEFLVNVPAYLQTEAVDVLKVTAALEAGADCVATWRTPRVDPWLNQLQSRLFNWFLRLIMGMPFHDLNSGMRGFRRQVLDEVSVYGELYRFLPVMALRQGFRVVEVKVRHREEKGRSGFYGIGVYLRRMLDILAITFLTRFTQQPLRFFGYVGFAAMVMGIGLAAYPLYEKLQGTSGLSDRPMFMIGAIMAAFGVQLIGFGLVGEIIIFTQAPNLRDYKIDEVIEGGAESPSATAAASSSEPHDGRGQGQDHQGRGSVAAGGSAGMPPPGPGPAGTAGETAPAATADAVPPPVPAAVAALGSGEELLLRVRELLPGEDSRWDAFVSRHPQGSFFHLSGWRRCVEEVFRHESAYLVAEQGRRWLGVLPLTEVSSPFLGGRNLVSTPYAVYGGVCAESAAAQQALLDRAAAIGRERGAGYVELRHLDERPGDRLTSNLYQTFRCELPDDPAAVMPGIPKKARAEVRRAREKLGIRFEGNCDLDLFFSLFAANKQRLGSPALPRRWFRALVEEFGSKVVLHRAVDPQGQTLAAVMSFLFRDTVAAYYSGSISGVNKTGVNDMIYCSIMEWAVEQGYTRFDFGRSRADTGPAMFKKNMGFQPEPLHYEYLLLRDSAHIPEFHPSNPKLALPRRLWSKLPRKSANWLGGRLSRYIP
jgi:FemAB-related protein (PEP-CTERM system-associated)